MDIEEDHVGVLCSDERDGGGHVVGLADRVDGTTQLVAHAGAEQVVVVDQHDPRSPDAHRAPRRASLRSSSAVVATTARYERRRGYMAQITNTTDDQAVREAHLGGGWMGLAPHSLLRSQVSGAVSSR